MTQTPMHRSVGTPRVRQDADLKVRGAAPYAFEQITAEATYLHPITSTVARGRVSSMDTAAAEALEGVVAVLTVFNAPKLANTDDQELSVLQSDGVAFRGQFIGGVVAETPEVAREAARLVEVSYDEHDHDTRLEPGDDELYAPDQVNPAYPTDSDEGDVEQAFADAAVRLDHTYTTPMEHNSPMEPHASIAVWVDQGDGGSPSLVLHDSTQAVHSVKNTLAPILGLEAEDVHVISPYVGGGFGSKGQPHAHNVLVALAAQRSGGRPVKLALTRQQMFSVVGYRTPTISRIRIGAESDGSLVSLWHDVVEQTSRIKEFAEQTATATRMMYSSPHRRTSHRLAPLDVPVPSWMRAPGEAPGMFALESAMDELAEACEVDPVELRRRNEPEVDPESGDPWSSRHLLECLDEGAERFGWSERQAPGARREGEWLVGYGVASSTYPAYTFPGSTARVELAADGCYEVSIGAADIGTGAWTILAQVAADALERPVEDIRMQIGDTDFPMASVAGGSSGTSSWSTAILAAAEAFTKEHGTDPSAGAAAEGTAEDPATEGYAAHSFGAHFVEARVNVDTGEVRVPRMLGVFSAGRIVNPRLARSQFMGGMTFGLSMALHEESFMDHHTGHVVTQDFANYHIPSHADVGELDVHWLEEEDLRVNALGAKGIGEIGIVGSAAAIANAVHNATGVRVRDLPITPDKLLRP